MLIKRIHWHSCGKYKTPLFIQCKYSVSHFIGNSSLINLNKDARHQKFINISTVMHVTMVCPLFTDRINKICQHLNTQCIQIYLFINIQSFTIGTQQTTK